jgi:ubiquinone/menaquinone biosynthesis C-methylase UbiE
VAALHAGAAIHCWPNPQAALAEISRVLRPGGVFVASTFLNAVAPLGQLLGDELVAPLSQVGRGWAGLWGRSGWERLDWWQQHERFLSARCTPRAPCPPCPPSWSPTRARTSGGAKRSCRT